MGRQVRNFDSKVWKEEVSKVAEEGTWLKFSQVEECREALLETGDRIIAEASPVDRIGELDLGVMKLKETKRNGEGTWLARH